MELHQELNSKIKELNISVKALRQSGTEYAEAERQYKIALREECLKLRDAGEAVGLINLTVHGVQHVANLRFTRDVKEAVYKANIEAINSIKLQLRLIENQINREWEISNS